MHEPDAPIHSAAIRLGVLSDGTDTVLLEFSERTCRDAGTIPLL